MTIRVGFVRNPRPPGQGVSFALFRYFKGNRPNGSRLVFIGYQRFRAVDLVSMHQDRLTPIRITAVGWFSLDADIPDHLIETCLADIRVIGHRHRRHGR